MKSIKKARFMNLIEPNKLQKGDTIGFLSVAGNVEDRIAVENAKKYFEECGYKVKISPNTFDSNNYLSGTDEARLEALTEFFSDDSINAIIALRGGYGSVKIINRINYDLIKANPKIFVGFSDITALSLMIYKKTGLMTFHGPMILSDFSGEVDNFTQKSFFDNLENAVTNIPLLPNSITYSKGAAQGILWGGNLSTIASLCGQDFIPGEMFILFIEDINEPAYKIDRMLTQLLNIASFKKNLGGILLGDFCGVDSQKYFDDIFYKLGEKLSIPIRSGLKFGHVKQKLTLPIGRLYNFDTALSSIQMHS